MSKSFTDFLECPVCHYRGEFTLHQSVDVSKSPELKKKLLQDQLNILDCPECDFQGDIDVPLLYQDKERLIFAYFIPYEGLEEDLKTTLFTPQGDFKMEEFDTEKDEDSMDIDIPSPHVVLSMDELRSYILFREDLQSLFLQKRK